MTLSVTPAQLTGNTTTATVTVNVANTVPAGSYTATVTGTAAGIGSTTVTYTLTVTATPNYTLSATAASVAQGGSGTSTISLARTSFTSPVTLTLESPPAGITGSFNPSPATGDQSVLTINVAPTVATGSHTLTVKGTAAGQTDKTTTVALTVTAPVTGNFTIAATPATLNLAAGASGNTSVAIVRTNFTTDVALSLVSPPAGITGVFTPATLTGTTLTSQLALTVAANVAAGSYPVTVRGTAGSVTHDATVTVTVPAPAGNFTISATPTALNLAAGASGNTSVAIVRTNFTTDVALSLVSPPAGITGVFTPATLTGTTLTSQLALSVASNVAAGSYPVTVRGTAGSVTQDATVTVTVTAAGNFTISATPTALNLQAGASGNTSVAIVRTNFTTDVALSLVSPPTGITGVFTPATLTGTTLSSQLALSVASNVTPGTYPVTVRGTAGAVTQNTTVNVTVTAPSGNNVSWEFCNTPNTVPLKFWVLTGSTWTEVTGTVVGSVTRFSFSLPSGSTGIAYTASASGFSTTYVYLAQSTELGSLAGVCTTPTTVQKTFNLTGQVGGEVGQLGYGSGSVATGAAASYNVTVAPGTYDWLWAFGTSSGSPIPTTTYTNYRIGRNEATSAGAVSVNRTGAPAFVTAPFSFTGGSAGGFWQTSQSLLGANGLVAGLSIGSILSSNGSGDMLFLQPGDRLGTDLWLLSATHLEVDQAGKGDTRTSARYVGSAPPASLTFALPGKVPAFTVASTTASIPWSATGSIPAEYQTAASTIAASFTGAGGNATATLIATRGWLVANNMSTTYTLTGPTLPNFLPAWAPTSPLTASSVIMVGSNLTGAPSAGGFLNTAIRIQ
ncbi:MAG TPA: hypothetical protein VF128_02465 [Gemmatimonadaceae bacterium]